MEGGRRLAHGTVALTVHGPSGALDLVVPPEASVDDVAREYAAKAGLQFAPDPAQPARDGTGRRVVAGRRSASAAATCWPPAAPYAGTRATTSRRSRTRRRPAPSRSCGSQWPSAVAALAGWFGSRVGGLDTDEGRLTVALLGFSAFLGVLPIGRLSAHRMVAAPAFAAAAAFAVVWAPEPERLPTVVGVSALVAAVAAGVARALDVQGDEALRVWIVVGVGLFLVTGAGALLHADPRVVWGLLLLAAMLAARFVPAIAIDVPDQFLIDLERLAVTAWSARDRPHGRRGRTVVPPAAVAQVAARGSRIVTASAAGVWVVVAVVRADAAGHRRPARRPDRRTGHGRPLGRGAAAGCAQHRHPAARAMLRGAGLTCWAALVVVLLGVVDPRQGFALGIAGILLAVLLVVVAVATGRGWRSAWWSRRAEVAEGPGRRRRDRGPRRRVRAVPCPVGNQVPGLAVFATGRPLVVRITHRIRPQERPHRTHNSGGFDMPLTERDEATWRRQR